MLQEIWNIVNTKIGVAVVTAVATTILNVIYNMWRMNKDQKMRFENVIGDKVAQALDVVRDLELKINVQEIYQAENRLEKKNMDCADCIYADIKRISFGVFYFCRIFGRDVSYVSTCGKCDLPPQRKAGIHKHNRFSNVCQQSTRGWKAFSQNALYRHFPGTPNLCEQ